MIKKSFAAVFLFFCLGSLMLTAEDSVTLELRVTVEEILEITVDAENVADNMVVSIDDALNELLVGTVTERTNSRTGYTVTIRSENASLLVNSDSSFTIPYTVTYGNEVIDLSGGSKIVVDTTSTTPASGSTREVKVSYTTQDVRADVYEDILTFVISSK